MGLQGSKIRWTYISVEDKPVPAECLEIRENILATWLARIFIREAKEEIDHRRKEVTPHVQQFRARTR